MSCTVIILHSLTHSILISRSGTTTEDRDVREVELPESLEDLHSICSVREEPQESRWETLWVTLGDEIRERAVAREPLSYAEHVTEDAEGHDREVAVARSAIMVRDLVVELN